MDASRTQRRLAASAAALLLMLLAVSFTPWFRRDVSGSPTDIHVWVNLWQASTLWELSFAASAATVMLLLLGLLVAHRSRIAAYTSGALVTAAAVTAVALWLRQWWLIEHPPPLTGRSYYYARTEGDSPPLADLYAIAKDSLPDLATPIGSEHAYQTGWAYIGAALVFAVGVVALGVVVRWINRTARI